MGGGEHYRDASYLQGSSDLVGMGLDEVGRSHLVHTVEVLATSPLAQFMPTTNHRVYLVQERDHGRVFHKLSEKAFPG